VLNSVRLLVKFSEIPYRYCDLGMRLLPSFASALALAFALLVCSCSFVPVVATCSPACTAPQTCNIYDQCTGATLTSTGGAPPESVQMMNVGFVPGDGRPGGFSKMFSINGPTAPTLTLDVGTVYRFQVTGDLPIIHAFYLSTAPEGCTPADTLANTLPSTEYCQV
jgi:hypothetical protein